MSAQSLGHEHESSPASQAKLPQTIPPEDDDTALELLEDEDDVELEDEEVELEEVVEDDEVVLPEEVEPEAPVVPPVVVCDEPVVDIDAAVVPLTEVEVVPGAPPSFEAAPSPEPSSSSKTSSMAEPVAQAP